MNSDGASEPLAIWKRTRTPSIVIIQPREAHQPSVVQTPIDR
jgi:hypothetical protein